MAGHSLGGLFFVDTLLNQPNLFNRYIAISPSLWCDQGPVIAEARQVFTPDRSLAKTLFPTHGDFEYNVENYPHSANVCDNPI